MHTLSGQYHPIAARRGAKRAEVAVAYSMIVILYHMLKGGSAYQDLDSNHFDEFNRNATVRRAVKRLEALRYKVTLEEAA